MAQYTKTTKTNSKNNTQPERTIFRLFTAYEVAHQHPTNKLISRIAMPLLFFSLFALVWSIPFPHIPFLGKYNGFVNWASFMLAICVFYYYRLSPVLSYFILFTFFAFSYVIIKLEQVEKAGGPALYVIPLVIFSISAISLLIAQSLEKSKQRILLRVKNLVIAPVYLWYLVLKRLPVRI